MHDLVFHKCIWDNHAQLASDNHKHASHNHAIAHLASHHKLIHWLTAGAPVVPQSHFLVKMPADDHL